jgi:hypothetical protein
MPKILRLSQPASSMRTCTSESIDSQIRGGLNITCGPMSRMSLRWVDASSGKESVIPRDRPQATAIICSPIQASGRKETKRSLGPSGSIEVRLSAIDSRLRWVSCPSFGREVVPEVVQTTAMSSGCPLATSSSNQPCRDCAQLRPCSSIVENSRSHGSE